jgi:hypothetical protein
MEHFLSAIEIEEEEESEDSTTMSGADTEKDDLSKEKSERKGHLSVRHNNAVEAHFFHAVLALHKKQFEKGASIRLHPFLSLCLSLPILFLDLRYTLSLYIYVYIY